MTSIPAAPVRSMDMVDSVPFAAPDVASMTRQRRPVDFSSDQDGDGDDDVDDDIASQASSEGDEGDENESVYRAPPPPPLPPRRRQPSTTSSGRSPRRIPVTPSPALPTAFDDATDDSESFNVICINKDRQPPPPVPPREPLSSASSTPPRLDAGDVWIHQQQQLNRRPPPPPSFRRMVSDREAVSRLSSSTSPTSVAPRRTVSVPAPLPRSPIQRQQSPTDSTSPLSPLPHPTARAPVGVVLDVNRLVCNSGFCCQCCCDIAAGAELTIVTTWCHRRSPIGNGHHRSGARTCSSAIQQPTGSRRFTTVVASPSPRSSLSCSRPLSPSSSTGTSTAAVPESGLIRMEPASVGGRRQRRANEYVDSPTSTSCLSSSSSSSPSVAVGKPTAPNASTGSRSSSRRFLLLVSSPSTRSSSPSSSVTAAALTTAGNQRLAATTSMPITVGTAMTDATEFRPRVVEVVSASALPSLSTFEAVEMSPNDTKMSNGGGRRCVHDESSGSDDDEHLSCTVCCGGSLTNGDDGVSDEQRGLSGGSGGGTGSRSLVAALCMPGLWLVRRAKASYRRRRRRPPQQPTAGVADVPEDGVGAATIGGEKRLGDGIVSAECSPATTPSTDVCVSPVT